ncbi:MAG: hypothetical protein JSS98_04970 [Bacteroidetes bacterium]|nr:hypothetical protein [Bacteroidota bacterium]
MKKTIITSLTVFTCLFASALNSQAININPKYSAMYCSTKSGTITNTETCESITVSCTKCTEAGQAEAAASALLCVNGLLKKAKDLL